MHWCFLTRCIGYVAYCLHMPVCTSGQQGFSEEDQEEVAKIKAMNSVDPLVIEKGASKDVNKAAKEFNQSAKETVSKVLGQEPPSKPTAWSGGALQVNVDANPVEQVTPLRFFPSPTACLLLCFTLASGVISTLM
jgi:hypothetical protein